MKPEVIKIVEENNSLLKELSSFVEKNDDLKNKLYGFINNQISLNNEFLNSIPNEIDKPSPEERFMQIIDGYGTDMDNEMYPDTLLFIHDKHGNYLFEYNQKNGRCWTSYYKVWSIFKEEYGYNYDEISDLIVGMVEQHFGWKDVTPLSNWIVWSNEVEQHFGWK